MMTGREQRVRMLAYRLWESEGRPEDQEARHWEMAERIVEAENAREEEHEWLEASDEPSPLEGEDPPAELDELGIDEQRLPLDDPETEARKEEDTGVEVETSPNESRSIATPKRAAATTASKTAKPATARRASTRATDSEKKEKETRSTKSKASSRKAPTAKDEASTGAKPASKPRTTRNKSE
ncbi:DUF2934 domain-containing protein [Salinicola halimionae]|uniref:DUF2934 domain-containing protein n=1 Tax=Salinicola halimionae TaxID=1949081 RepID=UPI001FD883DF|nr:DUF2934 domain-containing protein [Salinicola halimionae]